MQIVVDNRVTRLSMPASIKSLVIDSDGKRRLLVEELLGNIGYTTAESCSHIEDLSLQKNWQAHASYLLVICTSAVTDELLQTMQTFLDKNPMPVLMMSEDVSTQAIRRSTESGVCCFVTLHVQGNRIEQAIDSAFANFNMVQELKTQIIDLKTQLHDRVTIEKAKGLIIKNKHLDEKQAYSYLRDYSMKKSMKMIDVANMVIAAAELLEK